MIDWLLVDYGETISTPFNPDAVTRLANLAGQERAEFLRRYWNARPEYDLGQPTDSYWSHVLRRNPSDIRQLLAELNRIDMQGWLGLNRNTLQTLVNYQCQTGIPMALLSNAPEPLAAAIDSSDWSQHFVHRFYSCRLGHAKPDPTAFTAALDELGAEPHRVVFIDDRTDNTHAAQTLGIPAITYTTAYALTRALVRRARALPAATVERIMA